MDTYNFQTLSSDPTFIKMSPPCAVFLPFEERPCVQLSKSSWTVASILTSPPCPRLQPPCPNCPLLRTRKIVLPCLKSVRSRSAEVAVLSGAGSAVHIMAVKVTGEENSPTQTGSRRC
nr:hypothetical protein BgiMline_004249 [Biomphalaria glabrata]